MKYASTPFSTNKTSSRYWLVIIALILIVAVGVFLRFDDLYAWRHTIESEAFFKNQPIHTTADAWFYLGLSQDLLTDNYQPIDEKRGVPDSPPRQWPPPLLSVLAAFIVMITGISLDWAGAVIPALLGPLLAIPLYFVGRFYGGMVTGLSASLLSVLSPYYILRSNIGYFDTDCGIISLALAVTLFFIHFGIDTTKKRYLYIFSGMAVYLLFLWWWDQARNVATFLALMPLGTALALFYRPPRKEGFIFFGFLMIMLLLILVVIGIDQPLHIIQRSWQQLLYVAKDASGSFPNIGITISEQRSANLHDIVNWLFGLQIPDNAGHLTVIIYSLPLLSALAGLALLAWRRPAHALFLAPLFGVACLSFYANRFILFLTPVAALGLGLLLQELWNGLQRYSPLHIIVIIIALGLSTVTLFRYNVNFTTMPAIPGRLVAGMDAANRDTPANSVIWASWDHGYAINFYARRATVNDGSVHSGERTVYNEMPLAMDSERLAANFMLFYVIRGLQGIHLLSQVMGNDDSKALQLIKNVLRVGPQQGRTVIAQAQLTTKGPYQSLEDWVQFFFPPEQRPVYLFLDEKWPLAAHWWYWFGTWNIEKNKGRHPLVKTFSNLEQQDNWLTGDQGLRINLETGEITAEKIRARLSGLSSISDSGSHEKRYPHPGNVFFGMIPGKGYGLLMDTEFSNSVFSKLFIRQQYDKRYFHPVSLNQPVYQLWEVRGDYYK